MNIIDALEWRYATKEFDSTKKVSKEELETITESLRLTASSFGLQPWKFYIISNQELKDQLMAHSWGQKQVSDCSHHIVMCFPKSFNNEHVQEFIDDTSKTRGQSLEELEGYKNIMNGFLSRMDDNQKQVWMKDQVYIALGIY